MSETVQFFNGITQQEYQAVMLQFPHRVQLPVNNRDQLYHWARALAWLHEQHGTPKLESSPDPKTLDLCVRWGRKNSHWTGIGADEFQFEFLTDALLFKLTWGGA